MFSLFAIPYGWSQRKEQAAFTNNNTGRHGKHHDQPKFEFLGPPGAVTMLVALPLVIFGLYFACNAEQCISLNPFSSEFLQGRWPTTGLTAKEFFFKYLYSPRAILAYLSWFTLHVLLYFILPGKVVEGVELDGGVDGRSGTKSGKRLKYPMNGLLSLYVSIALVVSLAYFDIFPPTFAYDEFTQLAFTATVFSFLLAGYLYLQSLYDSRENGRFLRVENQLAAHGNTGYAVYDFFIGRSLNPRIGSLDLKFFCELRPGLILWVLINLSMAAKQYQLHGHLTNSMVLVNLFQGYYVYDALSSEVAILTTMDITSDGFGWMLAFGDLAWVPFTYCTQTRFLVDHPVNLPLWGVALVIAVKAAGFWIFRGANGQKNDFRTNPLGENVKHLSYIQTKSGSKLLTSGWWGLARHMNYFGDLLLGLSWCMPCGVTSIIPYFYFIYFSGLLGHRERRDEEKCAAKYGEDWKKYCKIVPSRIVPYIY